MSDRDHLLKAVFLTTYAVELQAVCSHLVDCYEKVHPTGTIYHRGSFSVAHGEWSVAVAQLIRTGNVSAAIEAEKAIHYFQPHVAIFVGTASGLDGHAMHAGDVVVATKVYGYEAGKAGRIFQPQPEIGLVTHALEQRAGVEASKDDWRQRIKGSAPAVQPGIYLGPIAAGEKVVASSEASLVAFLQASYSDTLAVDREGYGFLKTVHANQGLEALVVRGIASVIGHGDVVSMTPGQKEAANHASAFAFEVLAKHTRYALSRIQPANHNSQQTKSSTQGSRHNIQFHGSVRNVIIGDNSRIIDK